MSESPMIRSETRRSFDFLQDTRIRTLLIEVGEDPSYADLFSENSGGVPRRGSLVVTKPGGSVMQFQSATGTPKGKFALDAEGRRTILKALVTKIVAHVIGTRRVVMILDDAQWLDVASVDIVLAVVERCKNLCIVAFSRPLGNEHKIKSIPFDQKFTLAGLRYCEVEKCLLERLHGVKITPKLVQSVLEHSGGNLLQVDTLVTFLMDETEEHALDDEAIQNILSTRIETLIMTQFDRLDPFLQTVFKFSSILGHYFSISDLLLLLADPALTPSLLTKAIHAGDRFQFMIIEPSEIHFRHITIAKVIYESIPMADRQRLHEMVGEYYEGLAGEEGDERKMWMGVMCFHFWRSGNVEKKVARYVELGFTYFLDALPFETTTIFKELLQFLDDNDADVGKGRELIEVAMKADIIARLAWSSVNFVPHADTRRYAVRALEMSGVEWPKDLASVKTGILEAVKR
ncbi:hypothetical protein BC829DRAFT_401089 [Chytridium lagenaria]|nr:hypothetical protein BC829DRAFT_401089 [Chytridium lagenaria]